MTIQVSKSQFKAKALELMRQVEASGEPLIITDHGKPSLEMRSIKDEPAEKQDPFEMLKGSVLWYDRPFDPAVEPEEWDALR